MTCLPDSSYLPTMRYPGLPGILGVDEPLHSQRFKNVTPIVTFKQTEPTKQYIFQILKTLVHLTPSHQTNRKAQSVFWTGPFYLSEDHDSELIIVPGSSDCREQSVPPQAPEGAGPWMALSTIPPSPPIEEGELISVHLFLCQRPALQAIFGKGLRTSYQS